MIRFISPLVSKSFPELIHSNCIHRRLGLTEAHTQLCSPGSRFLLQWSRAVPATSGVTYGGTGGLRSFVNLSRTLTVLFLNPAILRSLWRNIPSCSCFCLLLAFISPTVESSGFCVLIGVTQIVVNSPVPLWSLTEYLKMPFEILISTGWGVWTAHTNSRNLAVEDNFSRPSLPDLPTQTMQAFPIPAILDELTSFKHKL